MDTETYPVSAQALETTSVCEIPFERLDELSEQLPQLRRQLMRLMSREIRDDQQMMLLLSKKTADERIATFLVNLSARFRARGFSAQQFRLAMSRNEIGNYLGLAVETVSRVFTRFQQNGLISAEGKEVHILDSIEPAPSPAASWKAEAPANRQRARLSAGPLYDGPRKTPSPGSSMIFDEFTLKSQIRAVPDFPKPGVVFRDITPLFQSPRALRMTVDSFVQRYIEADFSHIGAMDARGFLIGSAVAYALNKPLVLFRKQGKLPADVLAEGYQTEYGEAFLEVHADSLCEGDSVLIFDDLIATGGTLLAAASLVRRLGARVFEAAAIIDLPELGGSTRLQDAGISTFSLTAFALDER